MELRELAEKLRGADKYTSWDCRLKEITTGEAGCDYVGCYECIERSCKAIADIIEEAMKPNAALERLCERLDWGSPHDQRIAERIRRAAGHPEPAGSDAARELPEGASMPLDADGEPCLLDDAVWHKGAKHAVVAVSHKGKVCIRDWDTRDSGVGAKWVKAERVTHREPDTKESVRAKIVEAAKADCAVDLLPLFERYDQAVLREAGE